MTWNPFKDDQPPSSFMVILNEENEDENFSEDDDEDFWETIFEGEVADSNPREEEEEEALIEEHVVEEDGITVTLTAIFGENGEELYVAGRTPSRAFSAAHSTSPLSSPRLPSGAVSPITIPSPSPSPGRGLPLLPSRSDASSHIPIPSPPSPSRREPPPLASRSSASSPIPNEPIVIIGEGSGRGGRRQGSGRRRGGRGSRGGGRVGTRARRVAGADSAPWQPGDPISEIFLSDEDVPDELRRQIRAVISAREVRQLRNDRRRRTSARARRVVDDEGEKFFDAEDGNGDNALFPGEEEALNFNWSSMNSFEGSREPFLLGETGPTRTTSTAYEAFSQFWDENILGHIVSETNRYALTKNFSDWYETNVHEILVLFSFWMMLGIIRMPSIKSCFSTNPLLSTNFSV